MENLDFDTINNEILKFDLEGLFYSEPITPQINELKQVANRITNDNRFVCPSDIRNRVRSRIINVENFNRQISDDEISDICIFILSDFIPVEEKEIVAKHLSEEQKEELLNSYLKEKLQTSKYVDIDPDDISKTQIYTPRDNKVPLKYYQRDNYSNKIFPFNIEMPIEELSSLIKGNEKIETFDKFLCVRHLLNTDQFFNEKWLPKRIVDMKNQCNSIRNNEEVEKFLESNNNLMTQMVIEGNNETPKNVNDNFVNDIISSIPSDFSLTEKAIYVYSKLCRTLSYDSIYFIDDKSNPDLLNPEYSNQYDSENNKIVCHNFTYILSSVLSKIGVEYINDNISLTPDGKFRNHSNLTFISDGNVIFADSTRSVIEGDLTKHKFLPNLSGIRCQMYSKEKQDEFELAKQRVLGYVLLEEKKYNDSLPPKDEIERMKLNERIVLFNNCISNTEYLGVDFLSYSKFLIDYLDLKINTKVYYDNTNLDDILLNIEIPYYTEVSKEKFSYMVDADTKQVFLNTDENIIFKENLTSFKSR